jgi:translation initiation factor 2B subunit (eIF-2B alpha/beta/delta family)
MRSLSGRRVATIGNSSVVARALVYAHPTTIQVLVEGPADEGHLLVGDLRAAGRRVEAVSSDLLEAEVAVIGCEAVYADAPPPNLLPERLELVPGDAVLAPA